MTYTLSQNNLDEAWRQQLAHAKALISDALEHNGTGDDGHDYLTGALDLASHMESLRYDSDLAGLRELLAYDEIDPDTPDHLNDYSPLERGYASDGICEYLYSLQTLTNMIPAQIHRAQEG